jgi:hypothetical protein
MTAATADITAPAPVALHLKYRHKLRQAIKELAERRKAIKAAFALDHRSEEHQAALEAAGGRYRDDGREWLTALHIVLAEARGRVHCDAEAWAKGLAWNYSGVKMLAEARGLLVDNLVPAQ